MSQNEALRDKGLDSLFKRISEYEQQKQQQHKQQQQKQESRYAQKVYTRQLDVKQSEITDRLIAAAISIYRKIQPYLPTAVKANDLYTHLDGKELFEGLDLKITAEKTLLITLPTFSAVDRICKLHYIYVIFRDMVSYPYLNALGRLYRNHAYYDARRRKYDVDAVSVFVVANRASVDAAADNDHYHHQQQQHKQQQQTREGEQEGNGNGKDKGKGKKPLILGDCRSAMLLIGNNIADLINRISIIIASFYGSKLAGVFCGDQNLTMSKYALKHYMIKKSSSLLTELIKNDVLDLPTKELKLTNSTVSKITIRLLTILDTFVNIFKVTASTVQDTRKEMTENIINAMKRNVLKAIDKMGRESRFYITRKAWLVSLNNEAIYDLIMQCISVSVIDRVSAAETH